jgi:hypothetical protein
LTRQTTRVGVETNGRSRPIDSSAQPLSPTGTPRMRFLVPSIVLLVISQLTFADAPTSERITDKVVTLTATLESDPLGNEAPAMRQWLIAWVRETSDFTVNVCDVLGPIPKKKLPYSAELVAQHIFGNVAYQIKNPGQKDEILFQLAGVESVLKAYEAIAAKDSKARIKYFDELLEKQRQGLLKDQLGPKIAKVCARVSAAFSQDTAVEMHWIGLFGAYARNPPPNDPLPNATLFPFGEIPRPLLRTNQVPAKLGSRFGFLFTLSGPKARSAEVRLKIHYPPPGFLPGVDKPRVPVTDDRVPCMAELPCYVGYSFQSEDAILPGEWRMELLIDGAPVEKATFVVAEKSQVASNTSLERTRER